jgi:DNA-binding response OmpR family regulator
VGYGARMARANEAAIVEAATLPPNGQYPHADPTRTALVVAGDPGVAASLQIDLLALGYLPVPASFGDGLGDIPALAVILVVLGELAAAVQLSREARKASAPERAPILWVAGRDMEEDLVEHVAEFDDFLELPYTKAALRTRLHLARSRAVEAPDPIRRGELALNPQTFEAWIEDRPLQLTYMEYRLLAFLATNPHRVHTRHELLQRVWGKAYRGGVRTIDVHVRRLRAKLGPVHERMIETTRNVGYRMAPAA